MWKGINQVHWLSHYQKMWVDKVVRNLYELIEDYIVRFLHISKYKENSVHFDT